MQFRLIHHLRLITTRFDAVQPFQEPDTDSFVRHSVC